MNIKQNKVREALKNIPSVDEIINKFQITDTPLKFLKYSINIELSNIRTKILAGENINDIKKYTFNKINKIFNKIKNNSLQPVINGTGIILHTGLGRAPISKDILVDGILKNYPYSNLELNLETGKRGDRNIHVSSLFNSLCDCEDSTIVNNNASAVILMLNSLCNKKEVIISRGQLVEIGGSFRIPDVMNKSQSKMIEVGTTNKTHIKDYEDAITDNTSAIIYVHTSNYKVVGFTNEIDINKLHLLAKKYNLPLLIDLGSGSFADFKYLGLPFEKMISKYIKKGADIITFSGDKLLGGPQSGIIVGKKKYINIIKSNSLYRAFRCDKIRISIMETVLRTYYTSKKISDKNLSIQLFKRSRNKLKINANKIISGLSTEITKNYKINIVDSLVEAGSGSLPTEKIDSIAISIYSKIIKANKLYQFFLKNTNPVIGYIKNEIFYIDLKAVTNDQIDDLIKAMNKVLI
ncbi:MAG: L-seryl-tRNA(Sec) selenium transferase [Candidatus Marinimicrobia bacterium]|nr:L-seryl-tRNA(Sec) selenium transferase [Candidatus Neomarinimicrobiota bacterium]|tara:strand:- start:12041 stop:13435 length:1395 start_codon:yes stop_codon:yes gene_type:complete